MCLFEFSQTRIVRTENEANQPSRSLIIVHGAGVGRVEEPATRCFDGKTTLTVGMSKQRNEIHLRGEWQSDGIKIVPVGVDRFIENEFRFMCDERGMYAVSVQWSI
jgi:hypothetical protein